LLSDVDGAQALQLKLSELASDIKPKMARANLSQRRLSAIVVPVNIARGPGSADSAGDGRCDVEVCKGLGNKSSDKGGGED